jgi:hypothetical protein
MKRMDVPLGIVVAGLVMLVGCAIARWLPGMVIGGALILGVLAATARQRRSHD